MKYIVSAVVLAALASTQSLSDIPQCALPCIDDARTSSTNCAADDYACICRNEDALTAAATGCVISACGASVAAGQVLPAVDAFCNAVESGNSGSSASSEVTVSTVTTVTSTGIASTSTSAAETTTASSEVVTSTSETSITSVTPTSVSASNGTVSSTTGIGSTGGNPTAVPTAGATSLVGSLAMLALGFSIAL
ncbi:hypothetical protein F4677DRAFT_417283 [Hypoxylon crocopeplum]|nr:hypothetical protein F4677DRAFT_417283 [Hypoxylon crocopeplum]